MIALERVRPLVISSIDAVVKLISFRPCPAGDGFRVHRQRDERRFYRLRDTRVRTALGFGGGTGGVLIWRLLT